MCHNKNMTTTKTAAHSTYRIHSATTGQHLGDFVANGPGEALDAYARDAGYDDFADLLDRVPDSSRDDITVTAT